MTRILIVDDRHENLYLLRALLMGNGFTTEEAVNGVEALDKARRAPPDLIISDLLMPEMDGYTLLRHWKEDRQLRTIPFIVYTATYTEPKDEKLALDLGADAFIVKPSEPDFFLERVLKLLAKHKKGQLKPGQSVVEDEEDWIRQHNQALIRKLTEKTRQLEETNRVLERDIARRKETEERLRASESLYQTLFDATTLSISIQDCHTFSFVQVNQAFLDLYGLGAAKARELIPPYFCSFLAKGDGIQFQGYLDRVMKGEVVHTEILDCNLANETFWADKTIRKVTIQGQERIMTFTQNITEKKRMQDLIVQTEKVISLGVLAAGMAHEINNPLGVISQGVQNILRRTREPLPANLQAAEKYGLSLAKIGGYLEERNVFRSLAAIQDAVRRSAAIVGTLFEFSEKNESPHSLCDVNRVMEKSVLLAETDFDLKKKYDFRHIRIDFDLSLQCPIPCVASELEQVFLNLLRNSAQSLNEMHRQNPTISLRSRQEGEWAVIEVEDNGSGITPELKHKIFTPFFTTKKAGEGTGLGLSICYHIIVQRHGGEMAVESEPGSWTRFVLRLPLAEPAGDRKNLFKAVDASSFAPPGEPGNGKPLQ